jgi:choline-sulfatase
VLQRLADSEVAENTVVIYSSDHGENMGEHGLWWKNSLYDSAARVPLIISWPARWTGGQRRTQVCSLVDVAQTIGDLCGAKAPKDWSGDSMVRWLDDPNTRWKDRAVSEYYGHNIASGYAMIRIGSFKYVYHTAAGKDYPAERELYDLKDDPGEFHNLAAKPECAQRVATMHAALVKELGEDPDVTEQRCRADCARGYVREDGKTGNGRKSKKKAAMVPVSTGARVRDPQLEIVPWTPPT